jgi:amino acid adenylation domain-containing protein
MMVQDFLENSAKKYPEKIALICKDQRLTYKQLDEEANRLAHSFVAAGVHRGDRVVTFLPNSATAVISVFATLKAGGVFVVLNPGTKEDKLSFILNNCRASAMVTWTGRNGYDVSRWRNTPYLNTIVGVGGINTKATVPGKKILAFEEVRVGRDNTLPPVNKSIDIDLAALIYTSGSTGQPKGVMVTHHNIVSAATSITTYLENTPEDVVLNVLPLAFDYGLYQMLMMFKVGGTLVLHDSFAFPSVVIEKIIQERVTGLPIVPTVSAMLLQMDLSKYCFPKLRYITNTAAALPVEHIRKIRGLFPTVKIYSMYGLTECKRVSYLPPDQLDTRPASVGRGMPNEEVYIVDESGNRVGPGVIGELVIRGSNVMKGYWELPEETDRCLKPGVLPGEKVLYSGDLFTSDEEGYLYFVGRKDDIIKTRGEKVSPREVEDVIYALEGVTEAVVIGVPDRILGSAVKAVLIRSAGAQISEQDVLRHCKARLEEFMVPKFVEFVASLPKTESGKISKRALGTDDEGVATVSR